MPWACSRLALNTASPWHSLWGFVHQPWTSAGRATLAGGGDGPGSCQSLSSLPSLLPMALLSSRGPSFYPTLLRRCPAFSFGLQAQIVTFFRGLLIFYY